MKTKIKWDEIITPIVIARNTIIRKEMTESEYKIANEVMSNWVAWIKKNTIPKPETPRKEISSGGSVSKSFMYCSDDGCSM